MSVENGNTPTPPEGSDKENTSPKSEHSGFDSRVSLGFLSRLVKQIIPKSDQTDQLNQSAEFQLRLVDERRRAQMMLAKFEAQMNLEFKQRRQAEEIARQQQEAKRQQETLIQIQLQEEEEAKERLRLEQIQQQILVEQQKNREIEERLAKEEAERLKLQQEAVLAEEKADSIARAEILSKLIPNVVTSPLQEGHNFVEGSAHPASGIVSGPSTALEMGGIHETPEQKLARIELFSKHMNQKLLPNELADLGSQVKPLLLSSPNGAILSNELCKMMRKLQDKGSDDAAMDPLQEINEKFVNKIITPEVHKLMKNMLQSPNLNAHELVAHQKNMEILLLDAYKFGFETGWHALHDPYCADVRARLNNLFPGR